MYRFADKEEGNQKLFAAIKSHINACPSCKYEFNRLIMLKNAVASKHILKASKFFLPAVKAKIAQRQENKASIFNVLGEAALKFIPIPAAVFTVFVFFAIAQYKNFNSNNYLAAYFSCMDIEEDTAQDLFLFKEAR